MHATVVTDKPGTCPICGMKLEPVPAALTSGELKTSSGAAPTYFCPMHPTVVSDAKGTCPICEMDLEPIPAALKTGWSAEEADPGAAVTGRSVVTLSSERRALLGVRSEEVRETRIDRTIRTVGRVTADERRLAHVHTKFEGYVERLYVDFTGKFVKKGDPLLSLYSPELIATQQEYLLALRARKQLGGEPDSLGRPGAARTCWRPRRERLLLWDISPADIAELERTGTVRRAFDLHAEVSGFVTVKNVVQGMRVMPADTLFEIADLSHVWVLADVYESDLRSIRLGMPATMTLSYQPGREWRGQVTYIAPTVDGDDAHGQGPHRRRQPGRRRSNPDMFADVVLRVEEGQGLVVPDSAVIDTGDRRLVFLDRPDGTIEPREVEVGAKLADGYQVLRGLAKGDRVVTSANFLLDSESSLKAALAALTSPAPAPAAREALRSEPWFEPSSASARSNRVLVLLATACVVAYGLYTLQHIPVDAIPDLSDTQVIVYSRWDRSPDIIEDQVTYPIVTALLGAPKVKAIRGFSDFGFTYVYVIFEDGTDIYWARSRVLEYLSKIQPLLPAGRHDGARARRDRRRLGLSVRPGGRVRHARPRRPAHAPGLESPLPAAVGARRGRGGVDRRLRQKQYQVDVDPEPAAGLQHLGIMEVAEAIRTSNNEVGGRLLEFAGREYMVRGRGYVKSTAGPRADRRSGPTSRARPSCCATSRSVSLGPEIRRGIADLDGQGDTVGGIVVMRHGENALNVIERVKARLKEIKPSLPEGRRDRHHLRPLGADRTVDRHPQGRADARNRHRQPRDPDLPLAHPVGDHPDPHDPGLRAAGVHPDATSWGSDLEHHVAHRHRHLHRRARGRRDRRGRERLQAAGAVGARRAQGRLPRGPARGAAGGRAVGLLLAAGDRRGVPARSSPWWIRKGGCSNPSHRRRTSTMAIAALLALTLDPALRMLFTRMDFPTSGPAGCRGSSAR